MRVVLFAMPFVALGYTNTAKAADCTVSGDTVNCTPNETYDPVNHGGKKLHEYESVYLHRTANNQHGYAQFSNQIVFKDAFITVEGAQSDGVTLRNYGPTVDFNNLTITASGVSGDGINVGRDNSGGRLTVHQTATIESMQGMGIRSVSSEMGPEKHLIIFNGDSNIVTHSEGSWDAGHAVYAGTQTFGCGPSIFKFYACRTLSVGEIQLLGGAANSHNITTNGDGAYGIYANGWGHIVANNINVVTNGDNAHGVAAQRQSLDYYFNLNDTGVTDYSGDVELRGNVSVKVNGPGSYAFYADSYSAADGKDSVGKTASIRSFNSDTNTIVLDKIYEISGDMLATKSGVIDLWMGNGSRFHGATQIRDNGVLNLNIAGENSTWHLSDNSSFSEVTLRDKAALLLNAQGAQPVDYTLTGKFLNLAGTINLSSNSLAGDQLKLEGDYHSDGGQLFIDTELGLDGSASDKFIVKGDASGTGFVKVTNIGGQGGQTVNGIRIIEIDGVSGASFTLLGDYTHKGDQAVVGGAYAYRLFHNGLGVDSADGNWYLRSELKDKKPHYQPGAPVYEIYPQFLLGLNTLPTLQQRVGNRYWSHAGNLLLSQGADAIVPYAPGSEADNHTETSGIWGRVEGSYTKMQPRTSTSDATYDYSAYKMQAGIDGMLHEGETSKLIGGITVHYTHGVASVWSPYDSDLGRGRISSDGYGFGGTLTWYGDDGLYLDNQAQVTWHKSDLSYQGGDSILKEGNHAFVYALSTELGKRFTLNDHWSVTPQAQLNYTVADFNSFTDVFGAYVSRERAANLRGRLGVSLDYQNSWQNTQGMMNRSYVYGIANLYNEFLDGTKVDVSNVGFYNKSDRLWAGIGLGGSYNWNDDKYSLYGEGSVNTSLNHFGDSYSYKGTVGLRVKW